MQPLAAKFDRGVSFLCWAYNEEQSIKAFLKRASELLDSNVEDYEIILIDDGSTDRTFSIAKDFQRINPRLNIYQNERNLNVGISSRRAIARAGKEFLFWQTIDWAYDISQLRLFLEYLKEYDIVQGVRASAVPPDVSKSGFLSLLINLLRPQFICRRSDSIPKAIVSVINYMVIRTLFRIPLSDFQNVTFYPTRLIQGLNFQARSSFAGPEPLIKSYWQGKSIKEVPVNFIPRRQGQAKGTRLRAVSSSVLDIFRLWFKWVVLRKRGIIKKGNIFGFNPSEWENLKK